VVTVFPTGCVYVYVSLWCIVGERPNAKRIELAFGAKVSTEDCYFVLDA